MNIYRQGDVFFIEMPKAEVEGRRIKREGGRLIIARGETTGHAHAVKDAGVALLEAAELSQVWEAALAEIDFDIAHVKSAPIRYLEAERPFQVVHEEHDAISFESGQVLIVHQREYAPDALRRVLD